MMNVMKNTRIGAVSRRSSVSVKATSRVNQKKTDIIVSPSILSADFARLGEEVSALASEPPRESLSRHATRFATRLISTNVFRYITRRSRLSMLRAAIGSTLM